MLGYRVPAPDEAMLISGAKAGRDGTPFRVVTGHGAFVMPFFRQASFLTLAMREAEVAVRVAPPGFGRAGSIRRARATPVIFHSHAALPVTDVLPLTAKRLARSAGTGGFTPDSCRGGRILATGAQGQNRS